MSTGYNLDVLVASLTAQLELSTDGARTWTPVGDPRPCNTDTITWEIRDDLGAGTGVLARWVLLGPSGQRLEPNPDDYLIVLVGDTLTTTRPFGLIQGPHGA